MKFLAVALLSLISVSSFAGTVKCDIFKLDKSKNYEKVDSIIVGEMGPGRITLEFGKPIAGEEDIFVNAAISDMNGSNHVQVSILKNGPSRFTATGMILSASGRAQGLTASAANFSVYCSDKK